MQNLTLKAFLAFSVSIILGAVFTYIVRAYATRRGFVAAPKTDRWHSRPTAMLGGVAIYATTIVGYLLFVPYTRGSFDPAWRRHDPFFSSGSSMMSSIYGRIKSCLANSSVPPS
ncbi:MAG: hypothetical protein UZ17_ACD001000113 [Acidobacteria bacterium OLB17]|nr:MAG: hypothetical protein UZ17_ACD001000113 [Acidobacteria bacterium OLB17]